MQRLRAELPGGIALFGEDGVLLEANEAFHQTVGVASKRDFAVLFGAEPATFAPGAGEAVELGTRHWAVLAKPVPGWGWLCQLQDVSAWVKGRAEAAEEATRDGLTGLANRSLIMPEVARALADPSRPAALLAIDLDRFKAVNDTRCSARWGSACPPRSARTTLPRGWAATNSRCSSSARRSRRGPKDWPSGWWRC